MNCGSCRFWNDMSFNNRGTCQRYPQKVDTTMHYWCGEYAEAPAVVAEVPVETAVVEQAMPKRRGRPPKGLN